jgi:TolA-binding protein
MHRLTRVAARIAAVLLLAPISFAGARQGLAPDPGSQRHRTFLEGLRQRGYHDLADEYIEELLEDPGTPDALKPELAFERGRGKLREAEVANDLERRELLLEQGRVALDAFLNDHPGHELAPEAKVQLAQVLYQRGQTAALKAEEAADGTEREARLASARASFGEARTAFEAAIVDLKRAFDAFPNRVMTGDDPVKIAKDEAQRRMIDALLKRALVEYDEAQTYPEGSEERDARLDEAIARFGAIHNDYRVWFSGFAARMWQGKSLEEKGEIGPAMGIYNELLDHDDPRLSDLQRQVAFFRVIATRKREQYPLAERLARDWLAITRGRGSAYERLGMQLELARNIDAQLEAQEPAALANREPLVRDIVEQLGQVVRYSSPYKADAVELLKKYRPGTTIDARTLAGLSFDQAMERAREEMGLRSWDNAVALLRAALGKANPARDPDQANEARYLLAFALYSAGRYIEAAVLADFLARRYPDWESSQTAAEIGMGAMSMSYDRLEGPGKGEDLRRLEALADYTVSTWPDAPQADVARILRGDIALGQGRYVEAAEAFESVKTSAHKLDAKGKAAAAHWRQSLRLKAQAGEGDTPAEAAAGSARALELLGEAYQARVDARVPATDPERLRNAGDLAEIHLVEGRPAEALAIIDPHADAMDSATLNELTRGLFVRLLKQRLQAHIAEGETGEAIADMRALESINTGEALTQLFFGLGRLLESEMDRQREVGDLARLRASRDAFQQFLDALVESQSGQSFESLQWAGEQMLTLERPDRAAEIFDRVMGEFPDHDRLLRTRLKLSAAHRQARKFQDAWGVTAKLIEENPRALDFLIEQCQILEDWAAVEPGYWNVAIRYWQDLAKKLEGARPRPPEYYDCWYHVALCQYGKGSADSARRTLKSVMALSNSLGTAEIKQKYEELLGRVGG